METDGETGGRLALGDRGGQVGRALEAGRGGGDGSHGKCRRRGVAWCGGRAQKASLEEGPLEGPVELQPPEL